MTTSNATSSTCPECGKPLPEGKSLCPACLLAQAIASRTIAGQDAPDTPPSAPASPEEIADKFPAFEILECLGRGGMGAVYKARQKSLNRLVAIKILAPERERDARFASRFAREAELLAKLSHPHIVTIHDFGETAGLYYLVMEFINGVNLRDLLREGKMPPEQALAIVPPVCEALQYAHEQGIVHRDIKPENILLDRDGRVKIADFGIASLAGDAADPSGTPAYMAPEQQSVVRIVDHRADIYALGVVLYEMLTGERPAALPVAPSRRIQVDVRLDEVVLRALAQEPELRFQTAGEFRTLVETLAHPQAPADFSWQQQLRMQGVDYRSRRAFLGWPLVHIASGMDPRTGKRRIAKGWIAVGDTAVGGIAMGGMAFGGIAIGGLAGGILGFGGVALGVGAVGGLSVGLLMAIGGLAVGGIALGGMAIGYYAQGGGAMGAHVLSATVQDRQALRFFDPWARQLFKGMGLWMGGFMVLTFLANFFAFRWAGIKQQEQGTHKNNPPPPAPPSSPSSGGADSGRFPIGRSLLHLLPVIILSIVWLTSGLEKGAVLILGVVLTASLVLQMLGARKIRSKVLISVLAGLLLLGLLPMWLMRDKFGPVSEVKLPAVNADEACMLDLDSGKLIKPPHEVVATLRKPGALLTPEAFRWMQESGADVYARLGGLYLVNCDLTGTGTPKTGEIVSFSSWPTDRMPEGPAPTCSKTIAQVPWGEGFGWDARNLAFTTGDGARGVLDPVPNSSRLFRGDEGAAVRYKRLISHKPRRHADYKYAPVGGASDDGLQFRMSRTAGTGVPFLAALSDYQEGVGLYFLSGVVGDVHHVTRAWFIQDESGVKRLRIDLKSLDLPDAEMGNDLVMLWHGRVIAEVPPGRMQSSDGKQGIAFNPAALDPDEFLGYINRAGGKTDSSAKPVEAPTATGEGSGAGVER